MRYDKVYSYIPNQKLLIHTLYTHLLKRHYVFSGFWSYRVSLKVIQVDV
jgi:hypothetical protein